MAAWFVIVIKCSGAIRRFGLAVLTCELLIIIAGLLNALTWRAPLSVAYAEIAHLPFVIISFVLSLMALALVADGRLRAWSNRTKQGPSMVLALAQGNRELIYLAGLALALTCIVLLDYRRLDMEPRGSDFVNFPPARTASIEVMQREVALAPGGAFRGRALSLAEVSHNDSTY